jgi:c-di-GMP-binding flagellar brake protein YcgR
MLDKRRHKRITEHTSIAYRLPFRNLPEKFLTRDISQSGVMFLAHEFIPESTVVDIVVNLTKIPFSFQVYSRVKWARKDPSGDRYEVGVEFMNLSKNAKDRLVKYIDERIEETPL